MRSPVILRVFRGSQLVEVKQFDADQIVVGRQAEVQLDLQDEGVSPIHCMIELRDQGYYVCDLGSSGGTFKNGQAVLDESLNSGDEIQVGPFRVVFYVGVPKPKVAPPVTATPPPPPPAPVEKPVEKKEEKAAVVIPVAPPVAASPEPTPSIPASRPTEEKKAAPVAVPASKPAASASAKTSSAPVRPEIRGVQGGKKKRKKTGPTFAPPSEVKDLRQHLKPAKGNIVEVVVAWRERIIDTVHLRTRGQHRLGPNPRDAIRLANAGVPKNWSLVEIDTAVKVHVADSMDFEMITASQGRRKMDECLASGKAQRAGSATVVRLDQNEMICLGLGEIQLFIRYAPQAPVVPMLPPMGLSGAEMSGLIMAMMLTGLLAFYISATTPKDLYETPQEDLTHTAQIIFNQPPPKPEPPPPPPPEPPPPPPQKPPPPPPPPKKVEMADKQKEAQKKGQANNVAAQKAQTAGRASEVMPIPNSQNRPKKFTAVKQGGAQKTSETASANAQSKDVTKVGLFSAFGGGGMRSKLDQAYSGSGEVLGQADRATGTSGFNEDRAGDDLGSKFKATGAGGKGTATQGIAGIGTKGRGSGQSAYGAADGFGSKTSVAVEAGGAEEDFVGTIDKEAVRRRVRHYLHEIRGCYNRELNRMEKGRRLEGKVVVSWEIIAKGAARNVRIKSSTLGNAAVENCIRERLASWSFPEPPVGMTAEVSYPFYLRPEN
ncbi:MAG: FHA domain-containing protein [Bdellovibrionaceae bacterium]|nr:FHA domain-containing protein [Pseudobdellovibrionaceae bacterium]